jgi:hypothetical protein
MYFVDGSTVFLYEPVIESQAAADPAPHAAELSNTVKKSRPGSYAPHDLSIEIHRSGKGHGGKNPIRLSHQRTNVTSPRAKVRCRQGL